MECLFNQKLTVVGMVKIMAKDLEKKIKNSNTHKPDVKKMILNYNIFIYKNNQGYEKAKDEFMNMHIIPDIISKIRRLKDSDGFTFKNWNIIREDDYNRKYTDSELDLIKKYGYHGIEPKIKTIVFRNNDTGKEYFVETKLRSK